MQSGTFNSPTPSKVEKKWRTGAQHTVPSIVSQLLSATLTDEVFKVGNAEISQVTTLGIIRYTEKAPTNFVYKIDAIKAAHGCSPVG